MSTLSTWTVTARNSARGGANPIHDDDVARQHGFSGGLVPGVTTCGYLARVATAGWGREWLDHGWWDVRLIAPIYEYDLVTVRPGGPIAEDGTPAHAGPTMGGAEIVAIDALRPDGTVGGAGRFCRRVDATPPDAGAWPATVRPDPRHAPDPAVLSAVAHLGTLHVTMDADRCREFCADVDDDLDLYEREGVAPAGLVPWLSNYVLSASVALGPWIHTRSITQHHRAIPIGARVEFRAAVADLWSRKGRELIGLDIVVVSDLGVHARIRHEAIYRLG